VRITDERPIALKLLRIAAAHDGLAADRLRREAEALGLAWHPNVVEVVDHGRLPDGTTFLVLELLDGETLEARLRRGPLPLTEILKFSQALAEALIAIHAAGVVHRDLSPNNLFFARGPGAEATLKVLDFGIARVEWEELRITQTGVTLGTPGFIAPEQVAGEPVDARADLYAFGACLYAAAVGSAPPADPRARVPVPAPLQSLVDALLAADAASRPRDARAVRDALRALGSENALSDPASRRAETNA
jgi:serine/threonine-protein kinase